MPHLFPLAGVFRVGRPLPCAVGVKEGRIVFVIDLLTPAPLLTGLLVLLLSRPSTRVVAVLHLRPACVCFGLLVSCTPFVL